MMVHHLKCRIAYFDAVATGQKKFDVRRDDRGFQRGDEVHLHKWDDSRCPPAYATPTGYSSYRDGSETVVREIKYILTGGQLGIEPGYVVLGF